MKFGVDSSYAVPLVSTWHEKHAPTAADYEERKRRRQHLVLPLHALVETYSVLTRAPLPYRISPSQAQRILSQNFIDSVEVPALTANSVWAALTEMSRLELGGGLIYDTIIAQSCFQAGVTVLVTWNVKDFLRVAPSGLEIREPG